MALRHIDGFGFYATGHLVQVYEEVNDTARGTVSGTDRHGQATSAYRTQATSGGATGFGWIRKTIGGTEDTMIVGMAIFAVNNTGGDIGIFGLYEGGTLHCDLRLSTGSSTFDLRATRNGTQLGVVSAIVPASVWTYVEMKVTVHDTTGIVVVRVNGVEKLNLTSQDTRNGGTGFVDRILIGNAITNNNHDCYRDDIYVCDDTGSINNDFLGDVRVAPLVPTGAGNWTQWTPIAGSNFDRVDDEEPDDDTTYNSEASAGDKDTFAMGNIPSAAAAVAGIREITRVRKDDAGSRTLRQVLRISATDYESSDYPISGNYTYATNLRELNPNTSAAWTQSDVDGLEAGYKLEA